ncbi:MAG: HNH endonuclease [Phycisphaeraceae bacterium]|nr:HNH endonuclease [Phycisphaeraceae bacterium]
MIPDAGGRVHQFVVARAMLLAFVGPPPSPDKKQACHRNDVPTDDRIENLYWGSASDNVLDAVRNGRLNGSRRVRPHEPSAQKAFQAREMNPELRERVDPVVAAAVRLREFLGGKGRMSIFIDTPEGEWKLLLEPTSVAPAAAPARTPQGAAAC